VLSKAELNLAQLITITT